MWYIFTLRRKSFRKRPLGNNCWEKRWSNQHREIYISNFLSWIKMKLQERFSGLSTLEFRTPLGKHWKILIKIIQFLYTGTHQTLILSLLGSIWTPSPPTLLLIPCFISKYDKWYDILYSKNVGQKRSKNDKMYIFKKPLTILKMQTFLQNFK